MHPISKSKSSTKHLQAFNFVDQNTSQLSKSVFSQFLALFFGQGSFWYQELLLPSWTFFTTLKLNPTMMTSSLTALCCSTFPFQYLLLSLMSSWRSTQTGFIDRWTTQAKSLSYLVAELKLLSRKKINFHSPWALSLVFQPFYLWRSWHPLVVYTSASSSWFLFRYPCLPPCFLAPSSTTTSK